MTVFGGLLRSVENPERPLTDVTLAEILSAGGRTDAGVWVSEESAFQTTAVLRAITIVADVIAGLPLKAYRGEDRQRIRPPILDEPNPEMTAFEFWELLLVHLLGWGNAYALKRKDQLGRVVSLEPIRPNRVTPRRIRTDDGSTTKVFDVVDMDGHLTSGMSSADIFHIPGLGYDGLKGLGPIGLARQSIGLSQAAERFGARLFGSGSLMSGILKVAEALPDQAAAKRLKAQWQQMVSGLDNSHNIAVMDNGAEYQQVGIPPEDAQFLETRRFQIDEVARLFGLPPHLLAEVSGSTSWGSGIEQQNIGLVIFTLGGWMNRIESRATKELLPPGEFVEFDANGLLRGDAKARFEAYAKGIQNSVLKPSDARKLENLPYDPTVDFFLVPKNLEIVKAADEGATESAVTDLTRALQQVYLSVGTVITEDEAREIVNRMGAGLELGAGPSAAEEATNG